MERVYQVTYRRKSRGDSDIKASVYSEGHFRTIQMVANSKAGAEKIAAARLAKQFPDRFEAEDPETGEMVVLNEGSLVNGVHDPANAQSNYELQGVEVIG